MLSLIKVSECEFIIMRKDGGKHVAGDMRKCVSKLLDLGLELREIEDALVSLICNQGHQCAYFGLNGFFLFSAPLRDNNRQSA